MKTSALLRFPDDGPSLNPKQFSEFLSLLSACIIASNDLNLDPQKIEEAKAKLGKVTPATWNEYFDQDSPGLVQITGIKKQSPLEIILAATLVTIPLVALAIILSGGKMKCKLPIVGGEFEAELPPIGTGIKQLKEALGLNGQIKAGFSIRTVILVLNKEETALLLQENNGQGGFQTFLAKLRPRLNKSTRELTLGDAELERIMRYKMNPKKGGFQNRFKKIFGRHFPD